MSKSLQLTKRNGDVLVSNGVRFVPKPEYRPEANIVAGGFSDADQREFFCWAVGIFAGFFFGASFVYARAWMQAVIIILIAAALVVAVFTASKFMDNFFMRFAMMKGRKNE